MKKISLLTMLFISAIGFNGCNRSTDPAGWSNKKVESWFGSGEWHEGWDAVPDSSVNKKELAEMYYRFSDRWKKAFRFLAENDLKSLRPGRYEIDGDNVYATISNYMTREPDSVYFEAHRRYIDIQYVISGKELMGIAPLASVKEIVTPYDTERDIEFVTVNDPEYREATPRNFFIFFPGDAHKPGLIDSISLPVTKLVIKLKIDQALSNIK